MLNYSLLLSSIFSLQMGHYNCLVNACIVLHAYVYHYLSLAFLLAYHIFCLGNYFLFPEEHPLELPLMRV